MTKSVLIVDDDPGIVKYLETVLHESGYQSRSAGDGKEGLEKLQELKPHLVILDVMMPKKSGFVLFKQMKKDEGLKDIPVIMLTSVGEVVDVDMKAEDKGDTFGEIRESFSGKIEKLVGSFRSEGEVRPEIFLDKPVEPEALIEAVRKLVGAP